MGQADGDGQPLVLLQTDCDVTYIHIPGYGWWYAITVIDDFSRYLLAAYLTDRYGAAAATVALNRAMAEAEWIHGPLSKIPFIVTDNGPRFMARRFAQLAELGQEGEGKA